MAKTANERASIPIATGPMGAARAVIVAIGVSLGLAGCAAEELLPRTYGDLEESQDVETAEWPLLVDNPDRLTEADAAARIARGEEINQDLEARAALLQAEADLLVAQPSTADQMAAEAAAARAAGAALLADD